MLPHLIFVLKAAWATFRWGLNQELQLAEGPSSFGMFGWGTNIFEYTRPKLKFFSCCFFGFYAFYIWIIYWFIHDSWIHTYYHGSKPHPGTFFPTAPGSSFRNMRGSGSCPCPWQNHEPSEPRKKKRGTPYFPLYIQYWLFHRDPYFMVYEMIPT